MTGDGTAPAKSFDHRLARILLIDHDDVTIELCEHVLRSAGYENLHSSTDSNNAKDLAPERERIARHLHDHPTQLLAATALRLQLLQAGADPDSASELQAAIDCIRLAIDQLRDATEPGEEA